MQPSRRVFLVVAMLSLALVAAPAPSRAESGTFAHTDAIDISDTISGSGSTPYPATLEVSGLQGGIARMSVTLAGLSHARAMDLDVVLISPAGTAVLVMSDAGHGAPNISLTFDDTASGQLPASGVLAAGTYQPTDYAPADSLPHPAPSGPYEPTLASFTGTDPNGEWQLYVADDREGGDGSLGGGWSLTIVTDRPEVPVMQYLNDVSVAQHTTQNHLIAATDENLDPLTLTATGLPPFASFTDHGNGTGTITLAPGADHYGRYPEATITASDGSLTASSSFSTNVISLEWGPASWIDVRDDNVANPYPSVVTVSGLTGTISRVLLDIVIRYEHAEDLDLLLVSPSGQQVMLLSDAGAFTAITPTAQYWLDDTAHATFAELGGLATGTYRPTNHAGVDPDDTGDVFPALTTSFATTLSAFNGTNPNGEWRLYVIDDHLNFLADVSTSDIHWYLYVITGSPPSLAPIGDQVLAAGTTRNLTLTSTDPTGEPRGFSSLNLPSFATLTDHGNGTATLALAPNAGHAGLYQQVWITTSDGRFTDSEVISILVDGAPPSTAATLAPPANTAGWSKTNVAVTLTASDPEASSGIASLTYSATGAQPIPNTTVNASSATVNITTNGQTTITYAARDNAGHVEAAQTLVVKIDKTPPAMNGMPVAKFVTNTRLETSAMPVTIFAWLASDGGSGLKNYHMQQSVNGGALQNVTLPSLLATSAVRQLVPGTSYRYQVRAINNAGSLSALAVGPTITGAVFEEEHAAITYTGSWIRRGTAYSYGGSVRYATSAGQHATLAFNGTSVAWVSTRGTDRGKAEVWLDGVLQTTVDLYATALQGRRIVYSANNLAPGPHTLEIRALGTKHGASSGTRVDVDLFMSLS